MQIASNVKCPTICAINEYISVDDRDRLERFIDAKQPECKLYFSRINHGSGNDFRNPIDDDYDKNSICLSDIVAPNVAEINLIWCDASLNELKQLVSRMPPHSLLNLYGILVKGEGQILSSEQIPAELVSIAKKSGVTVEANSNYRI